jgi:hypothetical protein
VRVGRARVYRWHVGEPQPGQELRLRRVLGPTEGPIDSRFRRDPANGGIWTLWMKELTRPAKYTGRQRFRRAARLPS